MFDSPLSASAYEVLGVEPDVDDEALRKAYRLRLRQTHPDTGGDAAVFVQVQRAWELVGTAEARAAYDRGHGFGATPPPPEWSGWRGARGARRHAPEGAVVRSARRLAPRALPRPHARMGRAAASTLEDPYDPALVRSAPRQLRRMLADALAEEATARVVSDLGMGYTVWHDVAARRSAAATATTSSTTSC